MLKGKKEKRIIAILLAVVFAAAGMYCPVDVNAEDIEAGAETIEAGIEDTGAGVGDTETDVEDIEVDVEDIEVDAENYEVDGENPEAEYDGYIYKLRDDTSDADIAKMEDEIAELDGDREIEAIQDGGLYAADSMETIEEVTDSESVEYVEPNYIMKAFDGGSFVPNDPGYRPGMYRWQLSDINADMAWSRGILGQRTDGSTGKVTIAVLDTGLVGTGKYKFRHEDIDYTHVLKGYNVFTGTSDTQDYSGHGTAVTGIIAAKGNNGKGFLGAASSAYVYPVKALDKYGRGSEADVIRAMNKAISKGVDVINISAGFDPGVRPKGLEEICEAARQKGIIVVAASGNSGRNELIYPAAFPSVVSAGSVGSNGECSYFSTRNSEVDAAAPGGEIVAPGISGKSSYVQAEGTSFASPYVAALAVLAKSIKPGINTNGFRSILAETSTDRGTAGRDALYGYGTVNFDKACTKLLNGDRVSIYNANITTKYQTFFYTGKPLTPSVSVKHGFVTLTAGTDYSVTYSNNNGEGTAKYSVMTDGSRKYKGSVTKTFGIVKKDIAKSKVVLSATSYAYNGKIKRPKVKVTQAGRILTAGTDYKVTYSKGRKKVGRYSVTIKGAGTVPGSRTVHFKIRPRKTSIRSLNGGTGKITVKWKKRITQTSGYQIKYSTKSGKWITKTIRIKGTAKTSRTIKHLKRNKKYYVKVRTYKNVNGKRFYSVWSKTKTVRTH